MYHDSKIYKKKQNKKTQKTKQLYLDNVIFRNFYEEEPVILFLTFSDEFVPQGIAAVNQITYDNCIDDNYLIVDPYCGKYGCNERGGYNNSERFETQASRNMALYDYDGSASQMGKPTIITTHRDWWAVSGDCIYNYNLFLWYCPFWSKYHNDTWGFDHSYNHLGFIQLDIPGLTDGDSSDYYDPDDDSSSQFTVGYFSQFGRDYSTTYGVYPGAAGMTNTGWYFRRYVFFVFVCCFCFCSFVFLFLFCIY